MKLIIFLVACAIASIHAGAYERTRLRAALFGIAGAPEIWFWKGTPQIWLFLYIVTVCGAAAAFAWHSESIILGLFLLVTLPAFHKWRAHRAVNKELAAMGYSPADKRRILQGQRFQAKMDALFEDSKRRQERMMRERDRS